MTEKTFTQNLIFAGRIIKIEITETNEVKAFEITPDDWQLITPENYDKHIHSAIEFTQLRKKHAGL